MPKLKKFLIPFLISILLFEFWNPLSVKAQITECDVTLTPNQVDSGSTQDYTFNVTNGSAARIHWLKFTRPSGNFSLNSGTASGWSIVVDTDAVTFSGGSLNTFASRNFILNSVHAANVNAPSASWSVEASDDPSGTNPLACNGRVETQIGTPDTTAPVISNITVSAITTNSVIISWTTDEGSDSRVNFGTSVSYGQNSTSASFVTSHSRTLTGLSSSTGYHFQVVSADPSLNITASADNTFLTQDSSVGTSTSGSPASISNKTNKLPSGTASDKENPVVNLSTNLSKPFLEAPVINGTANDNLAISSVEYSTDNGLNYLPVDNLVGVNTKTVSFDFKPLGLPDGNYQVIARAFDSSGNAGQSQTQTLIIDKIAPLIGPSVVSFGPLINQPENNTLFASRGVDQKITLATIGGPTEVTIRAVAVDNTETKIFSLTKSRESERWSGILAFDKSGTFHLTVFGVDGAKNKTQRELNDVFVAASSKIVNPQGQEIKFAKVTVFYFNNETNSWLVWDAAAYGQQNPQITNKAGEFNFYLPQGRYYLKIEAANYQDLVTNIFDEKEGKSLSTNLTLHHTTEIKIGNFVFKFPDFSFRHPNVINNFSLPKSFDSIVGKNIADFDLKSVSIGAINSIDLTGKPTLITFLSTWSPNNEDQIKELQDLQKNTGINIVIIDLLESSQKVNSYKRIAQYSLNFIVDSQGKTLGEFNINAVPTHIFIKQDGTISAKIAKLLSKEELQSRLDKP